MPLVIGRSRAAAIALATLLVACSAPAPAASPGVTAEPHGGTGGVATARPAAPGIGRKEASAPQPPAPRRAHVGAAGRAARGLEPALAAELQAALERARGEADVPGLAMAIVLPDRSVWSGASGVASLESGVPLTTDTLFGVASITKPFIAALTMQLAEEGVLDLDEPLGRWVGEIPYGEAVTIRQLLGHTSGIRDFFGDEVSLIPTLLAEPERVWSPDEVLALLGAPYWEPGGGWRYSNSNYLLLGMVIQRATGRSVGEELRTRILEPLGLERTFLQPDQMPIGPFADGHTRTRDADGDGRPDSTSNGGPFRPDTAWASAAWTAGSVVSTAEDVARWGDALFGGRVLEDASLDDMLRFNEDGYGLGVQREELAGRTSWGHSGLLRGYTGLLLHFPDDRLTVVVLTNQDRVALDKLLLDRHGAPRSLLEIAFAAADSSPPAARRVAASRRGSAAAS